jgi:hypothetical protein
LCYTGGSPVIFFSNKLTQIRLPFAETTLKFFEHKIMISPENE